MPIEFNDLKKALVHMRKDVEKTKEKGNTAVSLELARDAKEEYIAFDSGMLGDSGVKTPKNLMGQGMVKWTTPYASRRYKENFKTPTSLQWDIKTWNKNNKKYMKQISKIYEEDIFK